MPLFITLALKLSATVSEKCITYQYNL